MQMFSAVVPGFERRRSRLTTEIPAESGHSVLSDRCLNSVKWSWKVKTVAEPATEGVLQQSTQPYKQKIVHGGQM